MDDPVSERMRELARHLISEYFFDPDREDAYKALIGAARADGVVSVVLDEAASGDHTIVLHALRTLLTFRVDIAGPSLAVSIEGAWSIHTEALLRPRVSIAQGSPASIAPVLQALCHDLVGDSLDDEEYAALMDSVEDE
jgi:hypothetical protein